MIVPAIHRKFPDGKSLVFKEDLQRINGLCYAKYVENNIYFQDPDGRLWEVAWNPQLLPEDIH